MVHQRSTDAKRRRTAMRQTYARPQLVLAAIPAPAPREAVVCIPYVTKPVLCNHGTQTDGAVCSQQELETYIVDACERTAEKTSHAVASRVAETFSEKLAKLEADNAELLRRLELLRQPAAPRLALTDTVAKLQDDLRGSRSANADLRRRLGAARKREEKMDRQIFELELELGKYIDLEEDDEEEEDGEEEREDTEGVFPVGGSISPVKPLCMYFLRGYCWNGDDCPHDHSDEPELYAHRGLRKRAAKQAAEGDVE